MLNPRNGGVMGTAATDASVLKSASLLPGLPLHRCVSLVTGWLKPMEGTAKKFDFR